MAFELIDSGWQEVMDDALKANHPYLRVVCPFIKLGVAERLLAHGKPKAIRVITRFNLDEFAFGVSDITALRHLLHHGAEVRGVKHLHAKVYLFGTTRAVATSANLTTAALTRNHEFGFSTDDAPVVATCGRYFDSLWQKAGANLTAAKLTEWETKVSAARSTGSKTQQPSLGDEGTNVGTGSPLVAAPAHTPVSEASQWFVKFSGAAHARAERSMSVLSQLKRSGSHWACSYPKGKRPRRLQDGAVIYLSRLVKKPDDIIIYGRAIGLRHRDGIDEATAADIAKRSWKKDWPHHVRVYDGQFVAGTLANGVSLNALKSALGANAFRVTKEHAARKKGNTDPNRAYLKQPSVELTREGAMWIEGRLRAAFDQYGALTPADLEELDWPASEAQATGGGRR